MKLQDALSNIQAPQGFTSIMAALMSGDTAPIKHDPATVTTALEQAEAKLKAVQEAQNKAQSDWAWWGYNGEIAYWSCIVDLLKAAQICGPDTLPDVPYPKMAGVVMDLQAAVQGFGRRVLKEAEHIGKVNELTAKAEGR